TMMTDCVTSKLRFGKALKVSDPLEYWTEAVPDSEYSLLTGPPIKNTLITTYFSGTSRKEKFTLDCLLWNGNQVIEVKEFKWNDGHWLGGMNGIVLKNGNGGFSAGDYDRSGIPIPSTLLLMGPAYWGYSA